MRKWLFISLLSLLPNLLLARDYSVLEFGAIGNGTTLNTSQIQSAIDQAYRDGGGRILFPSGTYLTGSIVLRSNVELHLKRNAILLGSTDPSHYIALRRWKALILADTAHHIKITGKGVIDGQGAQLALRMDAMFYDGLIDSADYSLAEKRPREQIRPQIIEFYDCRNIHILDITIKNSASWVQTYEICRNLTIKGITVDSDTYWNNDGIDILDCRNVLISRCDINASDDAICLKSEEWDLTEYCDSITIEYCKIRSSASAIKFGTSSVSKISNVRIHDIYVYDTYRSALAIESVQGGIIENVEVSKIFARNTGNAIFLRIGQIRNAKQPGILRNISISEMHVTVPLGRPDIKYNIKGPVVPGFQNTQPVVITGLPDQLIENISLKNIVISYPGRGNPAYANVPLNRIESIPNLRNHYPEFSMFGELPAWGMYIRHVRGIELNKVKLKVRHPDYRHAIVCDNVLEAKAKSLKINNFSQKNSVYLIHSPAWETSK